MLQLQQDPVIGASPNDPQLSCSSSLGRASPNNKRGEEDGSWQPDLEELSVPLTPLTADAVDDGPSESQLTKSNMQKGTDEHGTRIRMFTASITCDRAVKAGLANFEYADRIRPVTGSA